MLIGYTVKASELKGIECQHVGCTNPACSNIILQARCHPSAGSRVTVDKNAGVLSVVCAKCERHVVHIKVNE